MKTRGFTMIEILVATALTALVLIGLNTLIFSMAELWGNNNPRRTFDLHARAVTAFLEQELRTAAIAVTVTTTASATGGQQTGQTVAARGGGAAGGQSGSTSAFAWQAPSSASFGQSSSPQLTFTLPAGSRVIHWSAGTGRALPDVVCALQVRPGEGLFLLWHSEYETNYLTDPPRETLISPLVSALQYEFYDANSRQWTVEDEPQADNTGQLALPGRIRLTFTYENLNAEMSVLLPTPNQGLPPY
jgi:prepilin-type N-terminal cleavage/methylation domain-containing protein